MIVAKLALMVLLVVLGLVAAPCLAGPIPGRLRVVDANGAGVGTVLDGVGQFADVSVVRREAGVFFTMRVNRDGLQLVPDQLRFESVDCSGPAFLQVGSSTALFSEARS